MNDSFVAQASNLPYRRLRAARLALLALTGTLWAGAPTPSPWDAYNEGVRAYTTSDYAGAFEHWQDLTLQPVPRGLRSPVWFQLGNAQFRLGEPLERSAPEQAAELWRRSREAYRTLLARDARHAPARHNLALVEQRLARLTHRLGVELLQAAEPKPLDEAIELLRTSTENLNEAATLAPDDPEIRADQAKADTALRQRLLTRAGQAEAQGDQEAARKTPWNDASAEEQYRNSLSDLADAAHPTAPSEPPRAAEHRPPRALDQEAAQAQARVSQKLSDLLTRMGQRNQQAGNESARSDPDEALGQYESALDRFTEAQRVQAENQAAQRGEREVRAAMEQLHVRQGQQELESGREMLARKSPQAAQPLSSALSHFEAAQGLNPDNAEARAGAEEARRLLPEALVLAGQREMAAGERAEPQAPTEALSRYQEAEADFQQALELKPGQPQAAKGLQDVEPRLARLRERVAREAESAAQQRSPPNRPSPTLNALLGQVNERERPNDTERQRQRGQKRTGERRNPRDW